MKELTKTITANELRNMGSIFFDSWIKEKDNIKMNGKNLFALVSLKKALEAHITTIEETLITLANQFGGKAQENGSIIIPPEHIKEANEAFREFGLTPVEIKYKEIEFSEEDNLPVDILDAILQFITFKEN